MNYTTPCYVSVSLGQHLVLQGHHYSATSSHRDHSSNEDCHCSSFYNAQTNNSSKLLSSNKWQHITLLPASCLQHLLSLPRNTSAISRLSSSTPLPRPTSRTKKFELFVNFTLNKYQSNLLFSLDISSIFVLITHYCCCYCCHQSSHSLMHSLLLYF